MAAGEKVRCSNLGVEDAVTSHLMRGNLTRPISENAYDYPPRTLLIWIHPNHPFASL